METISFDAGARTERPASSAPSVAGFNHHGRAAANSNDLFAALLAIAGHDLRQPLQVILGAHDILARTLGGVVEQVQLARVEHAANKLSNELDQLVGALRLFEPSGNARQEMVELGPVFARFQAEFTEAAGLKGVGLRILPTRAAVLSNPVLLRGIVRNLIRNAIDYTPPGGRVLVAARRRESAVHVEVRDSGVGISAVDLADIFKPFRRLETSRSDGLGLGLFIVKCGAAFLGHSIEVCSAPGRGSRFVIAANDATAGERSSGTR
jgi:signal transduction histidine kinase